MNDSNERDEKPEERARWVENRRQFVIDTATAPPNEAIPFLFAVHEVWKWLFAMKELKARVADADFQLLASVVHECREFPLSTERQYWAPESLRQKDVIARGIEKRARKDVLTTFSRIANDLKEPL